MKAEDLPDSDVVHDSCDDVSDARRPTPGEREVLDLLGLDPEHRTWVRLSRTWWARVDALEARIARADAAIPAPRTSTDQEVSIP